MTGLFICQFSRKAHALPDAPFAFVEGSHVFRRLLQKIDLRPVQGIAHLHPLGVLRRLGTEDPGIFFLTSSLFCSIIIMNCGECGVGSRLRLRHNNAVLFYCLDIKSCKFFRVIFKYFFSKCFP